MTLAAFPVQARQLVALWGLGLLPSDDLPEIALALLDLPGSTSAAALAGATSSDDPRERSELFTAALAELGLKLPSRVEAARFLRLKIAVDVVCSARPCREAAELIRDVYHAVEFELPRGGWVGSELGVAEILGLYYAFDDAREPADHARLERDLFEAFKAIADEQPDGG